MRDGLLGEGVRNTGDRQNVPYSVFMTPPLSRVGMTEEQARASGAAVQVVTLPVAAIPRARVMDDTRGVLKAVVDTDTQQILGVSLLCVDSHEMINIIKTVMDAGLPYTVLRDQIFTHPSMSESLNDLFLSFNNKYRVCIFAPPVWGFLAHVSVSAVSAAPSDVEEDIAKLAQEKLASS